jgi:hypothetical protein
MNVLWKLEMHAVLAKVSNANSLLQKIRWADFNVGTETRPNQQFFWKLVVCLLVIYFPNKCLKQGTGGSHL